MLWHYRSGAFGIIKNIREFRDQPTEVSYEVWSIGKDGQPGEYMAEYPSMSLAGAKIDTMNLLREVGREALTANIEGAVNEGVTMNV